MPPRNPQASRCSPLRVAWALCLLACCAFAAQAVRTYGQQHDWWASVEAERFRYARWGSLAHAQVRSLIGDVEGMTRDQVVERLTERLGPADAFPRLPMPAGTWGIALPAWDADPRREAPVDWPVRAKNWDVIVPIYDGRADGMVVDTLKATFYAPRVPPVEWRIPLYTVAGACCAMLVATACGAVLWWVRRDYRSAFHVCLMAAVVAWAALLTTDWRMGAGASWRPLALGSGTLPKGLWEGPALGLLVGLFALRIPPRRPRPGVCAGCGYDLTGNVSGVCPECGETVVGRASPTAVATC